MFSKNLTKADVADIAGVSRAAVTKWFKSKTGWANVESKSILKLADSLKLSPDIFLQPTADMAPLQTRFLWDRLYPDMEHFIEALLQNRLPAIARLVQVLELHEAIAILGKKVIRRFEQYKKFIKPARRKELEVLWPLYVSRI